MFSLLMYFALKKAMDFRSDGSPQFRYFSGEDFGVKTSPFSFLYKKRVLRGERFFLPNASYKGLVVFFHGMGAGYTAYTQEIAYFAKQGYLVYAYDYLGCMTSEGRGIGSLCEPLLIQEEFFRFLDQDDAAKGLERYAVGHSWGGYAALGACREQFGVKAVISIAGFVSAVDMVCARAKGLEKFRFFVKNAIRLGYGKIGATDITECVKSSRARVLYIQGENDQAVPLENGIKRIQAAFPRDSRVQTVLIPESGHNPYWTKGGQLYMIDLARNHRYVSRDFDNQTVVDYARLNDDDPSFMKMMSDFLENIDKPSLGE